MATRIGSQALEVVRPDQLRERLESWALRREKVLALLDVRAAKEARRLAERCEAFVKTDYQASTEWVALRSEVAAFLGSYDRPEPSGLLPPADPRATVTTQRAQRRPREGDISETTPTRKMPAVRGKARGE